MTYRESFEKRYINKVKLSNNYIDLKPILTLIHEYLYDVPEVEEAYECIKMAEQDLFDKGIIPFKINGYEDLHKIEELPSSCVTDILRYIYYAVMSKEKEDAKLSPSK